MGDSEIVQVVDGRGDLPNDEGCFFLADSLLLGALVEGSSVHVLEDEVEVRLIVEAAVHLEDVGMLEAALDPDLEGQLVHHHVRLDQLLRDLLEREEPVCPLVPRKAHAPELPLS